MLKVQSPKFKVVLLSVLAVFSVLSARAAGVSTNKVFTIQTNNTLLPGETNFFVANSNLLNQAVNGGGGGGGGGGVSGIATLSGLGTNTYLTNATTSGQIATNIAVQGYGTNSLTVSAPTGPYHPFSTWSGGAQVSYTDSGGGYTIAGLGSFTGNGANITNVPTSGLAQSGAAAGQALEWNGSSWVPASINNYVNFALVGGVNDGVTDNTAAFSNACALAGNGGVIYMPKGVGYKVAGNINITNQVLTIMGDGGGNWALGKPDTFASVIIWTNLTTNCFTQLGQILTFQNISAFWTNTTPPSAGAFVLVTTNFDGVNGAVQLNGNNFFVDGGYRCLDYQAGQAWQLYNTLWVRWWYDGIRINNLANNDVGGWTILDSGWEALGNQYWGASNHVARSAIRWEGSGGGQVVNSGGGAFNWGSYNDNGGYTNAIDVQPEGVRGDSTSGLFFFNCIIDNWMQNAIYSHTGNTNSFSNIRLMGVQAESFTGSPGTGFSPVSLNGNIGSGSIIDNFSVVPGSSLGTAAAIYLNGMQNVTVGYVVNSGNAPYVEIAGSSTGTAILPDGTGFYDDYLGYPQLREGSFFVQSESANQTTLCENGYYTGSGWTYKNAGPSYAINYNPANNGTLDFVLFPTNTAGSSTSAYPVQLTLTGKGQATIPTNLTVGGAQAVNGGLAASNNTGPSLILQQTAGYSAEAATNPVTALGYNIGIGASSGAMTLRGSPNNTNTLALESGSNATRIVNIVQVTSSATNIVGEIDASGGVGNMSLTGEMTATTFSGSGNGLTSLPAGQLTGNVPSGTLPANLQVLNTNNAVNLTNIPAGQLTGALPPAVTGLVRYFTFGQPYSEMNGTCYYAPNQFAIGATSGSSTSNLAGAFQGIFYFTNLTVVAGSNISGMNPGSNNVITLMTNSASSWTPSAIQTALQAMTASSLSVTVSNTQNGNIGPVAMDTTHGFFLTNPVIVFKSVNSYGAFNGEFFGSVQASQ